MTNAELAQRLRDLRDFLIIAGYEESHAIRYTHIARTIEKMVEPVETLRNEGRLREIPQVGPLIQTYIKEILETGVSSKQKEWEEFAPWSVVEMVRVPGLGAKTARKLYALLGVKSLSDLKSAAEEGKLSDISGIGPALINAIRNYD